jgi:hypothetical protein
MTRTRAIALAVVLALVTAVPVAPAAAQSARNDKSGLAVPISGAESTGGTVAGTLLIKEFVRNGDGIDAIGTLTATVTNAGVARTIVTQVAWPVDLANSGSQTAAASGFAIQQAVCEILHLELGPLNLDLLGLVVDLNQVVLDITAVPGAGNLLGNLLCAVVGLLDGGGALTQITNLLNQILGILG